MTPTEKEKMMSATNLAVSQINRSYSDKNMSSINEDVSTDSVNVNEDVGECAKVQ